MANASIRRLQSEGKLVQAEWDPTTAGCLLHPEVWFRSYAHEWPRSMLVRAARLTLEVNLALLQDGLELKDATPANVLFEGPRPVFVDFTSAVSRSPGTAGWRAYGQFCRTFLIPLLLHRKGKLPLRWLFLGNRDGVAPEEALPMFRAGQRLAPSVLALVTLPAWLGRRTTASSPQPVERHPRVAEDVTRRLLQGLRHRLESLAAVPPRRSRWSSYQDEGSSYSPDGRAAKHAFVVQLLEKDRPRTVLDLGCNTGAFSKLAARAGARVIALDADAECADRLFCEAEAEGLDIQPLVADLGWPSPPLGWACAEESGLLERLQGRFDLTLALALVHHLLVRERVPLEGVIDFLADTTRKSLLVEWVPPADPQFARLAGPNASLYEGLGRDEFERKLSHRLQIRQWVDLPDSQRRLYLAERP